MIRYIPPFPKLIISWISTTIITGRTTIVSVIRVIVVSTRILALVIMVSESWLVGKISMIMALMISAPIISIVVIEVWIAGEFPWIIARKVIWITLVVSTLYFQNDLDLFGIHPYMRLSRRTLQDRTKSRIGVFCNVLWIVGFEHCITFISKITIER